MAHIAFFSVAAHGHVSPTLGIVAELVSHGHRVTYFTTGAFEERLTRLGARVCRYDVATSPGQSPRAFAENDLSALPLFFLHGSADRIALAESFVGADRPDLVVYDNTVPFAGRALARRWGARAVQFFPSLASSRSWALMDAMLARTGRSASHEANGAEFDARLAEFLHGAGLDGVRAEEFMDFEEELNLAFLPREFQPAAHTFGEHYRFVGPSLGGRGAEGTWHPADPDRPTVFASLGTVFNRATSFYRTCVEAFAGSGLHLVLSIGQQADPADLGTLPPHCEVHRSVPQLSVLGQAAAFVTHGGMGSTMEALSFGTPMVVVPQMVEQEIIADRVAELGLGLRLDPADVTAERLRAAVETVTADTAVAAAAARFRRLGHDAGGAAAAAAAIEAHLAGTGTAAHTKAAAI
ncbi:macrolide family glycosyltransferase [Streptomyces sp. W1SF4]|uniref:macrolide family glycosyltransferase n=1 Tax=Streptomyces sp. W1SF4 TaxID=2305220 RepID=UPI000F6F97CD|nr:macrolide family glycosyltransferase [Streptomyces sp. W1SF4]AZM94002.1 oleandomycin glycosyltransferase [Streptomyces sp. W1SF4]